MYLLATIFSVSLGFYFGLLFALSHRYFFFPLLFSPVSLPFPFCFKSSVIMILLERLASCLAVICSGLNLSSRVLPNRLFASPGCLLSKRGWVGRRMEF